MPTRCVSPRPACFDCSSLAALYEQYERLFLDGAGYRRDIVSACGLTVVLMDRHIFHLAGLRRASDPGAKLDIQRERPLMLAIKSGFGEYLWDESRAPQLPAALECILRPDAVFEPVPAVDSRLAFFKHYGDCRSPMVQVMIGDNELGDLIPKTAFQLSVRQARSRYRRFKPVWHALEKVA